MELKVNVVDEAVVCEFCCQLLEVGFGATLVLYVEGSDVVDMDGNCVVGKVCGEGLDGEEGPQ